MDIDVLPTTTTIATMAPVGVQTPVHRPGGDLLSAMSAHNVKARVQAIQSVMDAVMKRGVHFDVIPGTERKDRDGNDVSKPTLLKPGAEVLCMTFGLVPRVSITVVGDHPDIPYHWKDRKKEWFDGPRGRSFQWKEEDGETLGYFEVMATCEIMGPDGRLLATANGSCNNREKKYRTMNVYEVRNTIIKMAGKRAFVAATLLATAASDCFSQDLEDNVDSYDTPAPSRGNTQAPAPSSGGKDGWLSDAQKKLLFAKGKKQGYGEEVIRHVVHVLDGQPKSKGKAAFDLIADEKPEAVTEIWERAKSTVSSAAPATAPVDTPF